MTLYQYSIFITIEWFQFLTIDVKKKYIMFVLFM